MVLENKLAHTALVAVLGLLLTACMDSQNDLADQGVQQSSERSQEQAQQATPLQPPPVQTDTVNVNGLELTLWDNNGACQISDAKETLYLKPMSPCHFVRVAGALQLYKKGTTTVIATVGTPVKEARCGQEVQGILINNGSITISQKIGQGSIFCADKGLDGFHFSLF